MDRTKHIPLYIQLKEELKEKIRAGYWDVDFKIPTEIELMDIYKVGRATVREAISMLVDEGYLNKKQGIGTFVTRPKPSLGFEPLISLSYFIEGRGIKSENKVDFKEIINLDHNLAKITRGEVGESCFYVKRRRYGENTPIAIEESYFLGELGEKMLKADVTKSIAKIIVENLNVDINKVEQIITSREPCNDEKEILFIGEDGKVIELERWIYLKDSQTPFYYLKIIMSSDIYSY